MTGDRTLVVKPFLSFNSFKNIQKLANFQDGHTVDASEIPKCSTCYLCFTPACKKWVISESYWSLVRLQCISTSHQRPQAFGLLPFSRPEGLDRAHIAKFDFLAEPAICEVCSVKNPWIFTEGGTPYSPW